MCASGSCMGTDRLPCVAAHADVLHPKPYAAGPRKEISIDGICYKGGRASKQSTSRLG